MPPAMEQADLRAANALPPDMNRNGGVDTMPVSADLSRRAGHQTWGLLYLKKHLRDASLDLVASLKSPDSGGAAGEKRVLDGLQSLLTVLASGTIRDPDSQPAPLPRTPSDDLEKETLDFAKRLTLVTINHWDPVKIRRNTRVNLRATEIRTTLSKRTDLASLMEVLDSSAGNRRTEGPANVDKDWANPLALGVWAAYLFLVGKYKEAGGGTPNHFLAFQANRKAPLRMVLTANPDRREFDDPHIVLDPESSRELEPVRAYLAQWLCEFIRNADGDQIQGVSRWVCSGSDALPSSVIPPEYAYTLMCEASGRIEKRATEKDAQFISSVSKYMTEEWGVAEPNFEQAFALAGPMLLFHWFLGMDYFYSLPVPLTPEVCSTLSFATNASLVDDELEVLDSIATTLISRLLTNEYVSTLISTSRATDAYVSSRFLLHIFSKVFTHPTRYHIEKVRNILISMQPPDLAEDLRKRLNALRILVDWNDRLFRVVTAAQAGPQELMFRIPAGQVDISKDVIQPISEVFPYMKELVEPRQIQYPFELIMYNPVTDCAIFGHERYLIESVMNLIMNALHHLDAGKIKRKPKCAKIVLTVRRLNKREGDVLTISVLDRGCGIAPKDLERLKKKFDWTSDSPEAFRDQLADVLRQSTAKADENHFRIGLPLTSAYLHSLLWQPRVGRSGHLEIKSKTGKFTRVTLFIPCGGII